MVKKTNTKCICDCHAAEPVVAQESAAPKTKSTGKAKKGKSARKSNSPAQVKHQARFGLVAKLKKEHPNWTSEQQWAHARKEIV